MSEATYMTVLAFRNERQRPIFKRVVSLPHEAYQMAGMGHHGGKWDELLPLILKTMPDFLVVYLSKPPRDELESKVRELRKQLKEAKTELAVRG